jgi:hypothetical protein
LDGVPSLEVSSIETCKKGRVSKQSMFAKVKEINYCMNQRTCELSGEGLRRFRVFLATTFLTAVLVLVGAREAANSGVALLLKADFGEIGWFRIMTEAADSGVVLLLEADFGEIGWFCITTFFRGGEFLQKRTTGAWGKNSKGEPSSFVGSGPSSCCKETEQVTERIIVSCIRKIHKWWYLFYRDVIFSIELFQQRSQSSSEGMSLPHRPPVLKTIG